MHKKHCGQVTKPVQCPHYESTFTRKEAMLHHCRRFHSETAKQKVEANAELDRLELLTSPLSKVPRLTIEEEEGQTGGTVSTRGTKRSADEDITPRKKIHCGLQ